MQLKKQEIGNKITNFQLVLNNLILLKLSTLVTTCSSCQTGFLKSTRAAPRAFQNQFGTQSMSDKALNLWKIKFNHTSWKYIVMRYYYKLPLCRREYLVNITPLYRLQRATKTEQTSLARVPRPRLSSHLM